MTPPSQRVQEVRCCRLNGPQHLFTAPLRSHSSGPAGLLQFPKKILFPTDIRWTQNQDQLALIDDFVCVLEKFLGVRRTLIEVAKKWDETRPGVAGGELLRYYMDQVCLFERLEACG